MNCGIISNNGTAVYIFYRFFATGFLFCKGYLVYLVASVPVFYFLGILDAVCEFILCHAHPLDVVGGEDSPQYFKKPQGNGAGF